MEHCLKCLFRFSLLLLSGLAQGDQVLSTTAISSTKNSTPIETNFDDPNISSIKLESNSLVHRIIETVKEKRPKGKLLIATPLLHTPDYALPFSGVKTFQPGRWNIGPFAVILPKSKGIAGAVGLGIMLGVKRRSYTDKNRFWKIGIGAMINPNPKTRVYEMGTNKSLPGSKPKSRYGNGSDTVFLITFSTTFH